MDELPFERQSLERIALSAERHAHTRVRCTGFHRHNADLAAARFSLENGLRLILFPDARAPVFAYQTWFRVGSKHEDPQLTGVAHLFEHLMFKGTRQHAPGELDREMEARGTQTNAATWVDWTYYTETLAARGDNLETVARFEADRMVHLVIDEETFRSELEVVKNERRMVVEDSVPGELNEKLYAAAFTVHPYRWPTIGVMAHLDRATPADLERFYRAYYAPNNATLVVGGAIEVEPTLALLVRIYGPLPPQPTPRPAWAPEPAQTGARSLTLVRPVLAPLVCIGFRAPAQDQPDYAALEMLNEVLVAGDNGRLYRRLVTAEAVATEVSAALSPFGEPGLYEIFITLRPGVSPDEAVRITQEELDQLHRGLSAGELAKARNGLAAAVLDGLKDAEGCAESFGHFESNFDDFALAFRLLDRWQKPSAEDLLRVAASRLVAAQRTTVAAVAEEEP